MFEQKYLVQENGIFKMVKKPKKKAVKENVKSQTVRVKNEKK